MPTKHDWERSTWNRPTRAGALKLRALRLWLIEQTEGLADDAPLPFSLSELRDMLDRTAPGPGERGAQLRDRERGVTYRVTIDPTLGSVGVRTVEVEPDKPTADRGVYRVPVGELAREAAALAAFADEHADDEGRPAIVIGSRVSGTPTPEMLHELVVAGVPRRAIAERYDRSVERVDQWLRRARTDRPDLNWPPTKRGPRPQTPDGK